MTNIATDSDHIPVVCVQYCGDKTDATYSTDKAYCIPKDPVSDRQQAVCFKTDNMMKERFVVYPGVGITEPRKGNNPQPGDPCPTLTDDSRNYLVGKIAKDEDEQHMACFSIGSMNSNAMQSENPKAGIHETDVARTIDASGTNPSAWQGGVLICYSVDCRNGCLNKEMSSTLQCKPQGGWSVNVTNPVLMEMPHDK